MPIYETFAKRLMRLERQGKADVYQYDELPDAFRVQVIYIWSTAIGGYRQPGMMEPEIASNGFWRRIHDTLAREVGVFGLANGGDPYQRCSNHLLEGSTVQALDLIELTFRFIERDVPRIEYYLRSQAGITQDAEDAVEELNHRFQEHRIGYQYVSGQLVRVDSQYLHTETVLPAISLLHQSGFPGPSEEFLRAHEHYREGRNKEAIADALKAFESTIKAICDDRGWPYGTGATAKALVSIVFEKGLVPSELESHFSALRSVLESGLPTLRNKMGGHGQGKTPVSVPTHLGAYALHLAASNIVFLVEAHKAKK